MTVNMAAILLFVDKILCKTTTKILNVVHLDVDNDDSLQFTVIVYV